MGRKTGLKTVSGAAQNDGLNHLHKGAAQLIVIDFGKAADELTEFCIAELVHAFKVHGVFFEDSGMIFALDLSCLVIIVKVLDRDAQSPRNFIKPSR